MEDNIMTKTNKILTVVTNIGQFDNSGARTGLWLSELTKFWQVAETAGYTLHIASPKGGHIPLDPQGLIIAQIAGATGLRGDLTKKYEDEHFMAQLNNTLKLSDVKAKNYDAIYIVGGHGVMFDFPDDENLASLTAQFYETGKIVSSVCHGPSGLLNVKLSNDEYLVKGKNVTGFSWFEEILAKRHKIVPFNMEEQLKKRGAKFSKSFIPFGPHIIKDGQLITGQNPASAKGVGRAVVKALKNV